MNTINLIGNICNDIELKQTPSGKPVVTVNIAVKRPFTKETTDFIPLVVWDKNAEFLRNYARKGSKVGISGKLTTREYKDNQGHNRKVFEVVCDTIDLLDGRSAQEDANNPFVDKVPNQDSKPHVEPNFESVPTDEPLPF